MLRLSVRHRVLIAEDSAYDKVSIVLLSVHHRVAKASSELNSANSLILKILIKKSP